MEWKSTHTLVVSMTETQAHDDLRFQIPPGPFLDAYGVLPSAYRIFSDAVRQRQSLCWHGAEVVCVLLSSTPRQTVGNHAITTLPELEQGFLCRSPREGARAKDPDSPPAAIHQSTLLESGRRHTLKTDTDSARGCGNLMSERTAWPTRGGCEVDDL